MNKHLTCCVEHVLIILLVSIICCCKKNAEAYDRDTVQMPVFHNDILEMEIDTMKKENREIFNKKDSSMTLPEMYVKNMSLKSLLDSINRLDWKDDFHEFELHFLCQKMISLLSM